jgi:hypothetical protein
MIPRASSEEFARLDGIERRAFNKRLQIRFRNSLILHGRFFA